MSYFERSIVYGGIAIGISPPGDDGPIWISVVVLLYGVAFLYVSGYSMYRHVKSLPR